MTPEDRPSDFRALCQDHDSIDGRRCGNVGCDRIAGVGSCGPFLLASIISKGFAGTHSLSNSDQFVVSWVLCVLHIPTENTANE